MVYEIFLQEVKKRLTALLGETHTVVIRQVPKNNGVILDGLCIGTPGESIAPTIYLNSYYQDFEDGMSVEDIVDDILVLYRENTRIPDFDFSQFVNYPQLEDKIAYKLIQAGSNSLLLDDIPYLPYLDLAIVFYIFLEESDMGQMTALIHNEHLKVWNISLDELYETAKKNTPKLLPAELKSMVDVMKEFAKQRLGENYREEFLDELLKEEPDQSPLYVLTNEKGINGACCLLYENELKNFADELDSDLVLLPSSIHEVLIVPDGDNLCYQELRQMVTHINETEVPLEDRLSNEIYLYSRDKHNLSILPDSQIPLSLSDNSCRPG